MIRPSEMFFEMLREDEAVSDKESDVTDIKKHLNEAADCLHDKALVSETLGRTIVLVLNPESTELLSQWLRAEAKYNAGDELHDESCADGACNTITALRFAEYVLKREGKR